MDVGDDTLSTLTIGVGVVEVQQVTNNTGYWTTILNVDVGYGTLRDTGNLQVNGGIQVGYITSPVEVCSREVNVSLISGIRTIITSGDDGASWQAREALDFLTGWYQNIAVPGTGGQREQAFLVGKQGRIVALPLIATTAQ